MVNYKKILNIALPAMMENFLQMLMGTIDSYLVASLGAIAISGVSVANNIITIYQAIFIALGAIISGAISKSLGQGEEETLVQKATETIKLTVFLSAILGAVSFFFGEKILNLLGTERSVSQAGGTFLALVGGTIILLGLMTTFGALVRVTRNPRIPMYVSLLVNILNAIFSSFAIFILHWGIIGVALGTMAARLIGVWLLWKELHLSFAKWTWGIDMDLLRLSLPAAGERLMMRAGDVVIIAIVVKFGTNAVAGNAIGEVLTQFNYMPAFGVATATVMLVAHAMGQKNIKEISQISRQTYWISLALMLPIALLIFAFGRPLTQLSRLNDEGIAASLSVILFSLLGTPMTVGTVIYTAVWQGMGNAKLPFYATTVGMWMIRIIVGYILGVTLQLGLSGVWTATLLDNGFRWIFLQILYKRKIRRLE